MSWNFKDLTGMKFGRLTVIARAENDKHGKARFKCKCDCGNEVVVTGVNLKKGATQSCGCLSRERSVANLPNVYHHGMRHSKIYNTWCGIKARCFNPNEPAYKNYGGRGISVYPAWIHDFAAFYDYVSKLEHFGELGYTLDRKDNDGNYEPGNLRFADDNEQARNKRNNVMVEYNGEPMCLKDAATASGISYRVLYMRYHRGWAAADLFRPVGSK